MVERCNEKEAVVGEECEQTRRERQWKKERKRKEKKQESPKIDRKVEQVLGEKKKVLGSKRRAARVDTVKRSVHITLSLLVFL